MIDDEIQVAWAAGLFEGEGCIIDIPKTNFSRQRGLNLTMCDKDIVLRFAAVVECGTVTDRKWAKAKPNWRPQFVWRVSTWSDVAAILRAFLPYFGERRAAKTIEALAHPAGQYTRPLATHCKRNHPFSGPGSDVRITTSGSRQCLHCVRIVTGCRKGRPPLSSEQVAEIRQHYESGGITQRALALRYGVSQSRISQMVNSK